jgi:delta8-fatty-acid desaturase
MSRICHPALYPHLGLRLPMTFSYHAATTLKLMDAYRIGYILEPWINLTPPIRGGIYKKTTSDTDEDTSSSVDTDQASDSDCISVVSSATSLDSPASSIGTCDFSKDQSIAGPDVEVDGLRSRHSKGLKNSSAPVSSRLSPDVYIASAIRGEIEDGIRDNPSLDQETQREINLKYRKLHQRVQDEGFYQCRYIEYAKELTRYTIIFMAFMLALRNGWYITSACLLGLFWVISNRNLPKN